MRPAAVRSGAWRVRLPGMGLLELEKVARDPDCWIETLRPRCAAGFSTAGQSLVAKDGSLHRAKGGKACQRVEPSEREGFAFAVWAPRCSGRRPRRCGSASAAPAARARAGPWRLPPGVPGRALCRGTGPKGIQNLA